MTITDAVIVVLQAANRPMAIPELVQECLPYTNQFLSYFEVKQVCLHLFEKNRVLVQSVDPLAFMWRAEYDHHIAE